MGKAKKRASEANAADRLPPEAFRYLGTSLFGKRGWQRKMATELKVDEEIVKRWAVEGPPASLAKELSHIAGYHRGQIQAPLTMAGMPDADLNHGNVPRGCWTNTKASAQTQR